MMRSLLPFFYSHNRSTRSPAGDLIGVSTSAFLPLRRLGSAALMPVTLGDWNVFSEA